MYLSLRRQAEYLPNNFLDTPNQTPYFDRMPAANPILREPSLPRLPAADRDLFNLFAAVHLDIHALSGMSGRDLAELTAWSAAPEIRLWIDAYREIAGHALLRAATAALLDSMRLTTDLVEKRRAATAILRAHAAKPKPAASPRSSPAPDGGGGAPQGARGREGSVSTPSTPPPRSTAPLALPPLPARDLTPATTFNLRAPLPATTFPAPSPRITTFTPRPTSTLAAAAGRAGPAP